MTTKLARVCQGLPRVRKAPHTGMTAIYRLAPITRAVRTLQANGGAAVSRLWCTSINPPPMTSGQEHACEIYITILFACKIHAKFYAPSPKVPSPVPPLIPPGRPQSPVRLARCAFVCGVLRSGADFLPIEISSKYPFFCLINEMFP